MRNIRKWEIGKWEISENEKYCESKEPYIAALRESSIRNHTASYCDTLQHTGTNLQFIATHTAAHCNTLRHTAAHCNTLQQAATHCNRCNTLHAGVMTHSGIEGRRKWSNTSQHTAATLQHPGTHCNTLQHTAKHCNTPQHMIYDAQRHQEGRKWATTLQHTATHCNQHTATHCYTLLHTATHCNTLQHMSPDAQQCQDRHKWTKYSPSKKLPNLLYQKSDVFHTKRTLYSTLKEPYIVSEEPYIAPQHRGSRKWAATKHWQTLGNPAPAQVWMPVKRALYSIYIIYLKSPVFFTRATNSINRALYRKWAATKRWQLWEIKHLRRVDANGLQCIAVYCSVLQCAAVCCSVVNVLMQVCLYVMIW